jgi:hypothetical protein
MAKVNWRGSAEREAGAPGELTDDLPPEHEVAPVHTRISHEHCRKTPISLLRISDRHAASRPSSPSSLVYLNSFWIIELKNGGDRDIETRERKKTARARIG